MSQKRSFRTKEKRTIHDPPRADEVADTAPPVAETVTDAAAETFSSFPTGVRKESVTSYVPAAPYVCSGSRR